MKKLLLIVAILASSAPCFAQWTTSGNNTIHANTGNVGVGTSTPDARLSVVSASYPGLNITGNGSTWQGPDLYIGRSTANSTEGFSPCIQFGQKDNPSYGALLQSYQGQFQFFTAGGSGWLESMKITANGKVGICTSNPLSKFQVEAGAVKASLGNAASPYLNYGTSYLGFNAARDNGTWVIDGDGAHNGGGVIYSTIFGDIYFASIESTGTAGKTLADAEVKDRIKFRISPDGITHAKQVVVETANWPDYVFKPTYKLPSLSAVKTYIDQNQHLPDMPSEADVAKDGVNLGEMNKLLLKKVEELTLYLIEKDKQISNQQKQNAKQDSRIAALEKALNTRKK